MIRDEGGERCLTPENDAAGAYVTMNGCDPGDPWTKWVWESGGRLRHFLTGMCLELDPADQLLAHLQPCAAATAQRWNLLGDFSLAGEPLLGRDGWRYYP